MKNGKYSRKGSKRIVTLLLALVLILGCGIGGTLAYLTANTNEVTNTFVVGDIGTLDLEETKGEGKDDGKKQFVIVPGVPMEKDPKVTYAYPAKTENADEYVQQDVYIFVEVDAVAGTSGGWQFAQATTDGVSTYTYNVQNNKVHWDVANGWTLLENENDVQVYYRAVAASEIDAEGEEWSVIKDDKIYVESTLVKEEVATAAAAADDIVFKAYAIQQASFEVYDTDAEGNKTLNVAASAAKAWDALTPTP